MMRRPKREHADDRLDAEISAHLLLLAREFERQGLTPEDARLAARRSFGGIQRTQEAHRDLRGWRWLGDCRADVRYAFRALLRTPLFAAVAVLTVALGVGANTAIFSIINGLFLRQLPLPNPEQLVELRGVPGDLRALQLLATRRELFQGVASHELTQFNLGAGADAEWVDGLWASAGFLETLGARLSAGRGFVPSDDLPRGGPDGGVAIISDQLWRRRYGGSPSVLGQQLTVNRMPVRIVGITAPGFFGLVPGRSFDVMLPMGLRASLFSEEIFGADIGRTVARLSSGVDAEEATALFRQAHIPLRAEMAQQGVVTDAEQMAHPIAVGGVTGTDDPRRQNPYGRPLLMLWGLVGFVLLIACANLANLLMARATSRRQELAIRCALGGTRARLIRQLIVESAVIAAAGSIAGVVFAVWASRFLVNLFAEEAAFSSGRIMYGAASLRVDLSLDWRVLTFTAVAAIVTVLLFGVAPAVVGTRVRPMHALKEHGQNTPDRRPAAYANAVIASQVAVSLLLLVGALLLGRTFAALAGIDLGFEPERVLSIDAEPPRGMDARQALDAYRRALSELRALPGVAAAGLSNGALTGGSGIGVRAAGVSDHARIRPVSDGWLRALGGRLFAGRDFGPGDRLGAPAVAIVNRTFAARFFGAGNPIGQAIELAAEGPSPMPRVVIVGVAGDMTASARERRAPQVYVPLDQVPPEADLLAIALAEGGLSFSVRAADGTAPLTLRRTAGEAMMRAHPDFGLTFRTMDDELAGLLTRERVLALLAGFFGAVGLLLAAVGLYGVTSYTVGRRTREIGIRMVLGASRASVLTMVLARATLLVMAGVTVGVAGSWWLSTFLVALLFGVEPQDPVTLAAAAATLMAVGAAAAAIPAWRASRIEAAVVLRAQ